MIQDNNKTKTQLKNELEKSEAEHKKVKEAILGRRILLLTASMFFLLIIIFWLNEILDFPHFLLGSLHSPFNWPEAIIETVLIASIGIFVVLILIRGITEIKQTQKDLEKSRKMYQELYDEAPIGYHELDREGNIVQVNKTETEMLGYTLKEMKGKSIFDFISPEERKEARKAFRQKIEKRKPIKGFKRKYMRKNGQMIHVFIEDRVAVNEEGKITGIRSTLQDITEREHAAEERRKSEEHFREVIENIFKFVPEGLLVFTDKLNLFMKNKAFQNIVNEYSEKLNYTEQELAEIIIEQVKNRIINEDYTEIRISKT